MAILFWDEIEVGRQCAVPCWPVDANGDDLDCPESAMLTGVMNEGQVFKSEDAAAFNPKHQTWVCADCRAAAGVEVGE